MEENKVLGIETAKYTKICYTLILIASGFGVLSNLVGLVGMSLFGGFITGILGLVGIGLTITAFIGFKNNFSDVDVSHFIFLIILFIASVLFGLIFSGLLLKMGVLGSILMFLLSVFQFSLLWVGFQLLRTGQSATKDSIITGMKNLPQSFKK